MKWKKEYMNEVIAVETKTREREKCSVTKQLLRIT